MDVSLTAELPNSLLSDQADWVVEVPCVREGEASNRWLPHYSADLGTG